MVLTVKHKCAQNNEPMYRHIYWIVALKYMLRCLGTIIKFVRNPSQLQINLHHFINIHYRGYSQLKTPDLVLPAHQHSV